MDPPQPVGCAFLCPILEQAVHLFPMCKRVVSMDIRADGKLKRNVKESFAGRVKEYINAVFSETILPLHNPTTIGSKSSMFWLASNQLLLGELKGALKACTEENPEDCAFLRDTSLEGDSAQTVLEGIMVSIGLVQAPPYRDDCDFAKLYKGNNNFISLNHIPLHTSLNISFTSHM